MTSFSVGVLSFLLPLIRSQGVNPGFQGYPNGGYGGQQQLNLRSNNGYPYQQGQQNQYYQQQQAQQGLQSARPAAAGAAAVPAISARTELECNYDANSGPFCKRSKLSPFLCHHNDNYPRDTANYIEDNYGSTFKGLSITEVDVWDVYDGPISEDKDSICETDIELVRPGYAKNVKDQWRAVMQGTDVTQTVRVERCLRPGTPCKHVPGCFETNCKQRYSFVRLLVFDPCNKFSGPSYDMFRVPTACDCQLSPAKKAPSGGFGMGGIPDFISNAPEMANQMKNVDGAGFGNIPSGSSSSVNGRR